MILELLKGRDDRDGVTGRDGLPGPRRALEPDGQDGTNGKKETREREETLESWDHQDHLVLSVEEQPTYDGEGHSVLT